MVDLFFQGWITSITGQRIEVYQFLNKQKAATLTHKPAKHKI
jgi:hypothetical protein